MKIFICAICLQKSKHIAFALPATIVLVIPKINKREGIFIRVKIKKTRKNQEKLTKKRKNARITRVAIIILQSNTVSIAIPVIIAVILTKINKREGIFQIGKIKKERKVKWKVTKKRQNARILISAICLQKSKSKSFANPVIIVLVIPKIDKRDGFFLIEEITKKGKYQEK